MSTLNDVKVYEGKSGNIIFELEKIQNGFADSKPRSNSTFLKTGKFETFCFSVSLIRDASPDETMQYIEMKLAFEQKELDLAIPLKELYKGEIFRLALHIDRFRLIEHTERNGKPVVHAIKLNGKNGSCFFENDVKAIRL